MAKTQSQYADDIYNDSLARAEAQKKAREQSDARTLAQINKAIDDAAGTAVSGYQQNIDTAPQQFQGYYDSNAVDEAFAREQIKNSMAEAGMSASGQNLSMQTALSLQRNRQDAAVDAEQRDYVREMQNAIDAVKANAAAQKQDQEIQMTTARNQWWDNILSSIRDSSQTAAAEMYAADQEAAAKQTQAVIDSASEYEKNRTDYAMHLMKNMDYTEDQAWAAAYAQYPSGDATNAPATDEVTSALSRAKSVVGNQNLLGGIHGGWDWWQTRFLRTDLGEVNQTVSEVTKQLEKLPAYSSATDKEKEYMVAYAVANSLKANRGTAKEKSALLPYLRKVLTEEQYEIVVEEYDVKD